jgi:hypothetical protein
MVTVGNRSQPLVNPFFGPLPTHNKQSYNAIEISQMMQMPTQLSSSRLPF